MNSENPYDPTRTGQTPTVHRIQASVRAFPGMPALFSALIPRINDPEIDFSLLSEQIRFDPGVTMNILRVVNSARFSGSQRIDSLKQAMVRLGAKRLFHLIVAQGVATHLAEKLDGYELEPRTLLRHSIGVSLAAEDLARHLGFPNDGSLFTAGLLHDMGKLILNPFVLETRAQFDALLHGTNNAFDAMEQDVLGVSHPEAGAWLMDQWNFPANLVETVACHHRPRGAPQQQQNALMIHLADTLVYSQGIGNGIDGFRYSVDEGAADALGLRARDLERISSGILKPLLELESMM